MIEVLKTTEPKARKRHKCDFCHGVIPKGAHYHNSTNLYDGDVWTWKNHKHCQKLIKALGMEEYEGAISFEIFEESIQTSYYENLPEGEVKLHYSETEKMTLAVCKRLGIELN